MMFSKTCELLFVIFQKICMTDTFSLCLLVRFMFLLPNFLVDFMKVHKFKSFRGAWAMEEFPDVQIGKEGSK